jgi:hypothetical protein
MNRNYRTNFWKDFRKKIPGYIVGWEKMAKSGKFFDSLQKK